MKKLLELLAVDKQSGEFGVEIEVEGKGLKLVENQYWNTVDDPSLRGVYPESRAEYVFKNPLVLDKVGLALKNLNDELKGANPVFSFRTSCHVHVNAQQLTYIQLLNFIYTYLLLEEPLLSLCGDERLGNRFCLRLQDAEGFSELLFYLFSNNAKNGLKYINYRRDQYRYSAINLEALPKYGSVEFRAMGGTLNREKIFNWCLLLSKIKEYAISKNSPKDVYNDFIENDPHVFMKKVFKTAISNFKDVNYIADIQKSFSLSLDLPFLFNKAEKAKVFEEQPDVVDPIKESWIKRIIVEDAIARVARPVGEGLVIRDDVIIENPAPIRKKRIPAPADIFQPEA